ncbi:MAG: hypothetical protein H7Y86_20620 [Rhizobacter sp.]|nr:hypothetical protein [Ferruginibacter sp.]
MRTIFKGMLLLLLSSYGFLSCKKEATVAAATANETRYLSVSMNEPATINVGSFMGEENIIIARQPYYSCISELKKQNGFTTYTYKPGTNYEGADQTILKMQATKEGGAQVEKIIIIQINVSR